MYNYNYLYLIALLAVVIIALGIYYLSASYNRAKKRLSKLSIEQQNELLRHVNDQPSTISDNIIKGSALSKMDLFDE
ncbi:hypothetical protein B9J93_08125 [Vibrio sp. V17_P4S1T151]|uniref:hypothetical protein n=1 Tax=unclassified Vibrio TaxID=2614977 RepID=UPI000B8E9B5C|nr:MULTISPECIES: hypothetical protein [unclassified Vibrio]OXX46976.1 hypothetical protein B9J93_08125 [Vibrio sp. V17_P4S1T151]OXX62043.1 hypothetical protein B9J94_17900 [Vibrio sp. V20_P4S3T152]OXX62678.1 hypothetical protein B9J89_08175 [Vibrio sp. V15_P4S5T153]